MDLRELTLRTLKRTRLTHLMPTRPTLRTLFTLHTFFRLGKRGGLVLNHEASNGHSKWLAVYRTAKSILSILLLHILWLAGLKLGYPIFHTPIH